MDSVRTYLMSGRVTWWLIAVNVAVWCAIALGCDASATCLQGDAAGLAHTPWSPLTYALSHVYLTHLILNCAVLAAVGCIVEHLCGGRHVLLLYVTGSLAGAACFIALNVLADTTTGTLSGASAAIVAMTACAGMIAQRPQSMWLWGALAVMLVAGFHGDNPGGTAAHIGGVCAGIVYALIIKKLLKPTALA